MMRFVAPALAVLPLLAGVSTEVATAAPLGFLESYTSLVNQTQGGTIVKVGEWCGNDSFRDEYGHCRHYSFSAYGALPAAPHEECPPDRHFVHWVNHSGGRCVPNY
jgi:hypothetical protein